MKRNPNLREKYLDGEKLYRKYFEMGDAKTIDRLVRWSISQGMKSSKGNEPTHMGVWKAMWRWASLKENKEIAWEIFRHYNFNSLRAEWDKDMVDNKIKAAWQHPTDAKYRRFLKENGWS